MVKNSSWSEWSWQTKDTSPPTIFWTRFLYNFYFSTASEKLLSTSWVFCLKPPKFIIPARKIKLVKILDPNTFNACDLVLVLGLISWNSFLGNILSKLTAAIKSKGGDGYWDITNGLHIRCVGKFQMFALRWAVSGDCGAFCCRTFRI